MENFIDKVLEKVRDSIKGFNYTLDGDGVSDIPTGFGVDDNSEKGEIFKVAYEAGFRDAVKNTIYFFTDFGSDPKETANKDFKLTLGRQMFHSLTEVELDRIEGKTLKQVLGLDEPVQFNLRLEFTDSN